MQKPSRESSANSHHSKSNQKSAVQLTVKPGQYVVVEKGSSFVPPDFKTFVSSLYQPDPEFDYPPLNFNSGDDSWKSIAGNILTGFAPRQKWYDFQKYIVNKNMISHDKRVSKLIEPIKTHHTFNYEDNNSSDRDLDSPLRTVAKKEIKTDHKEEFFQQQIDVIPEVDTVKKTHIHDYIFNKAMNAKSLDNYQKAKKSDRGFQMMEHQVKIKAEDLNPETIAQGQVSIISTNIKNTTPQINTEKGLVIVQNVIPGHHKPLKANNQGRSQEKPHSYHALPNPKPEIKPEPSIDASLEQKLGNKGRDSKDFPKTPDIFKRTSENLDDDLGSPVWSHLGVSEDEGPKLSKEISREQSASGQERMMMNRESPENPTIVGSSPTSRRIVIKPSMTRRKSDISNFSGGECKKMKKHSDILLQNDIIHLNERGTTGAKTFTSLILQRSMTKKLSSLFLDRQNTRTTTKALTYKSLVNENISPEPLSGRKRTKESKENDQTQSPLPKKIISVQRQPQIQRSSMNCLGNFKVKKIIPVPAVHLHVNDNSKTVPTVPDGALSGENPQMFKSYQGGEMKDAVELVLKNNPRAADIFNEKKKQRSKSKPRDSQMVLTSANVTPAHIKHAILKPLLKQGRSSSVGQLRQATKSPYELCLPFARVEDVGGQKKNEAVSVSTIDK